MTIKPKLSRLADPLFRVRFFARISRRKQEANVDADRAEEYLGPPDHVDASDEKSVDKKLDAPVLGQERRGVEVDNFEGIESAEPRASPVERREGDPRSLTRKGPGSANLRGRKPTVKSDGLLSLRRRRKRQRRSLVARPKTAKGPVILDPRFTDVANARRFISAHGEDFRYCPDWGKWLHWDGIRWRIHPDDSVPITKTVLTMMNLRRSALQKGDPLLANWATTSQGSARVHAAVTLASKSPSLSINYTELDNDPWTLNVQNGTIDLKKGDFTTDHDRTKLCTKVAQTVYDPGAICPTWIRFLMTAMDGNTDLINMLQRIVGYCLTGSVQEQALFFFYGEGSNGKSTFLSTIQKLLGDYSQTAPRGLLESDRSNDHDTRLALLYRARLVVGSEVESGKHLAESLVKDLTGGDRITARRMREDPWHFDPTHKIIMQGNHKPRVQGMDLGFWRRLKLIPWSVIVPPERRDPDLPKKLEVEFSGILNWAVMGCMAWLTDGAGLRTSLTDHATTIYRNEQFDMQRLPELFREFCGSTLELGVGFRIQKKDLWTAYIKWSQENSHPIGDDVQKVISERLFFYMREDMELGEARSGDARFWTGARLRIRSEN